MTDPGMSCCYPCVALFRSTAARRKRRSLSRRHGRAQHNVPVNTNYAELAVATTSVNVGGGHAAAGHTRPLAKTFNWVCKVAGFNGSDHHRHYIPEVKILVLLR